MVYSQILRRLRQQKTNYRRRGAKKAIGKGMKDAILYSGNDRYTQRMASALKGIIDAGLQVPVDEETFPADERIKGDHLKVKNDIGKIKTSIDSGDKAT
jgi:large subunit ribosomal protein L18